LRVVSPVLATIGITRPRVSRGREKEPVEVEEFLVHGHDVLLEACRDRLLAMRTKYPASPPDGFVIFDRAGNVVARRFRVHR
jgi:ribose 1,5-bisphosphokinase PhnN